MFLWICQDCGWQYFRPKCRPDHCAIRSEDEPLEVIEVLNPRIDPEDLAGKFIVLDILAKDRHGRRINVEMQVKRFDPWSARSTYYLASALTKQITSGEGYADIKPVIGIHLLDFELFTEPQQLSQAHWCFEMRDRWQPDTKLGSELNGTDLSTIACQILPFALSLSKGSRRLRQAQPEREPLKSVPLGREGDLICYILYS